MAITHAGRREIHCKVLLAGPSGAGKTELLRSIYRSTAPEMLRGELEFAGPPARTQFFDFLPVSLGQARDFNLRCHLLTAPSAILFPRVRPLFLHGVDGFVFVADSRAHALAANLEALAQLAADLGPADSISGGLWRPGVFVYNHRDDAQALPIETLRRVLNPEVRPDLAACALRDEGPLEALRSVAHQIARELGKSSSDSAYRSRSEGPGGHPSPREGEACPPT